ncbi:hypothetical protein QQY24_13420 [Streptomyces sp. TG1A-8]|uniref:hypothetical protein n=1 Tax=Streptomyces sp. TG1A-8 TaxID=3051385 RepID=UPI00265C68D6|nr:hypothetical protein [Streptomyces sp. TG1A-8]MDO0926372.1 hypothetical protein [Streptomyces sp. TG1A-8]
MRPVAVPAGPGVPPCTAAADRPAAAVQRRLPDPVESQAVVRGRAVGLAHHLTDPPGRRTRPPRG